MTLPQYLEQIKKRLSLATLNFDRMHFNYLPKSRDGRTTRADMCAKIAQVQFDNWLQNSYAAPSDLAKLVRVVEVLREGLRLIDKRKEGFEEDLVECPQMAFDALKEADAIVREK